MSSGKTPRRKREPRVETNLAASDKPHDSKGSAAQRANAAGTEQIPNTESDDDNDEKHTGSDIVGGKKAGSPGDKSARQGQVNYHTAVNRTAPDGGTVKSNRTRQSDGGTGGKRQATGQDKGRLAAKPNEENSAGVHNKQGESQRGSTYEEFNMKEAGSPQVLALMNREVAGDETQGDDQLHSREETDSKKQGRRRDGSEEQERRRDGSVEQQSGSDAETESETRKEIDPNTSSSARTGSNPITGSNSRTGTDPITGSNSGTGTDPIARSNTGKGPDFNTGSNANTASDPSTRPVANIKVEITTGGRQELRSLACEDSQRADQESQEYTGQQRQPVGRMPYGLTSSSISRPCMQSHTQSALSPNHLHGPNISQMNHVVSAQSPHQQGGDLVVPARRSKAANNVLPNKPSVEQILNQKKKPRWLGGYHGLGRESGVLTDDEISDVVHIDGTSEACGDSSHELDRLTLENSSDGSQEHNSTKIRILNDLDDDRFKTASASSRPVHDGRSMLSETNRSEGNEHSDGNETLELSLTPVSFYNKTHRDYSGLQAYHPSIQTSVFPPGEDMSSMPQLEEVPPKKYYSTLRGNSPLSFGEPLENRDLASQHQQQSILNKSSVNSGNDARGGTSRLEDHEPHVDKFESGNHGGNTYDLNRELRDAEKQGRISKVHKSSSNSSETIYSTSSAHSEAGLTEFSPNDSAKMQKVQSKRKAETSSELDLSPDQWKTNDNNISMTDDPVSSVPIQKALSVAEAPDVKTKCEEPSHGDSSKNRSAKPPQPKV